MKRLLPFLAAIVLVCGITAVLIYRYQNEDIRITLVQELKKKNLEPTIYEMYGDGKMVLYYDSISAPAGQLPEELIDAVAELLESKPQFTVYVDPDDHGMFYRYEWLTNKQQLVEAQCREAPSCLWKVTISVSEK